MKENRQKLSNPLYRLLPRITEQECHHHLITTRPSSVSHLFAPEAMRRKKIADSRAGSAFKNTEPTGGVSIFKSAMPFEE
jgi:hypothetical protein